MPSVQVTNKKDWNTEVKDERLSRVKQQNIQDKVGKAEHPVKMPCNPSSATQSPPPTDGELQTNHHGYNKKSIVGRTIEEAKAKMAKEAHLSVHRHLQREDHKIGKIKDFKVSGDAKPRQATKTDGQIKSECEIFELLILDVEELRVRKQRSVSSSCETKETHLPTRKVSAPAALQVCKESPREEQVFDESQTEEKKSEDPLKEVSKDGKRVDVELKPQEKAKENMIGNEDGQKDDAKAREVKKQDIGKDDSQPEQSSSEDKPQVNKVDTRRNEATEDVSSDACDLKKEKVKAEEEAKKTVADIASLTQSLQNNLNLDDGEKAQESKSKGKEESGRSRLISRGINNMGRQDGMNLTSNTHYNFGGFQQSQHSHYAAAQPGRTQVAQPNFQTNVLPSFNKAFRPSVVSPPGQGNYMPIFMNRPGTVHMVQGPVIAQSKQSQLAQNALSPHPQSYPMNDLSRGGLTYQPPQQKVPVESTGQPVEVCWPDPLTPESITDMIDSMTSDEESVKSPMENEEPMQNSSLMDFLPSPQSPWQTAPSVASSYSPQHSPFAEQTAPSVGSSMSPQHSPYHDPQGSPFQRVPDASPWTPDSSNIGSPGESLPPESPTYNIQMGMTAGTMTVQDRSSFAPRAPNKQEEEKKIQEIERMLMKPSDPSQSPPQFFQDLAPSIYQVDPYAHMAPLSPPTEVIPGSFGTHQHTPNQVYQAGVTPYMEELELYKALVAEKTVKDILYADKDRDTVLHLAICKDQVALSVAIIERLWMEKRSLDLLNNLQQTPLYLSVVCKLDILTQSLISSGANLGIGNMDGNTPLHAAAMMGYTEAVKTIIRCMTYSRCSFLEFSALFDQTNFDGKTALMVAIEAHSESVNCAEVVRVLLMSNANPMFPDDQSGKTALHYAVELQKMDLITILLDECQDTSKLVNAKMYNGNTALHLIVGRCIPEAHILHIVGALMSRGANVSISNDANEKPCDLVRREHCQVKHQLHGREHHKR
ncbi:uncharacterized protein [Asterias amurensis]|uniref:uncharacterized protein n=1 Tax=Asterias amurensis TaxID=7602 RepID=UPI003AB35786